MRMFKDFMYVCFRVRTKDGDKWFLNYKKARAHLDAVGNVSKTFDGIHLIKGLHRFYSLTLPLVWEQSPQPMKLSSENFIMVGDAEK